MCFIGRVPHCRPGWTIYYTVHTYAYIKWMISKCRKSKKNSGDSVYSVHSQRCATQQPFYCIMNFDRLQTLDTIRKAFRWRLNAVKSHRVDDKRRQTPTRAHRQPEKLGRQRSCCMMVTRPPAQEWMLSAVVVTGHYHTLDMVHLSGQVWHGKVVLQAAVVKASTLLVLTHR